MLHRTTLKTHPRRLVFTSVEAPVAFQAELSGTLAAEHNLRVRGCYRGRYALGSGVL